MHWAVIMGEAILLLAVLGVVVGARRRRLRRTAPVLVGLLAVSLWLLFSEAPASLKPAPVLDRPVAVEDDGHVFAGACRSCHPGNYDTWYASYHRTMTQIASPEAIQGPFDNRVVELEGRTYRMFRRGEEFWVDMEDPTFRGPGQAPRIQRRIVMVTGSHHRQIYWYAAGVGRELGIFPPSYLIEADRWIPRSSAFVTPPGSIFEGEDGHWNRGCIKCHTTHGRPLVFDDPALTDTRVAEFGISCQECHGPGEEHIAVNTNMVRRYKHHLAGARDSTIVDPANLPHDRASEVCGQCHSIAHHFHDADAARFTRAGFRFRPGDELDKTIFVSNYDDIFLADLAQQPPVVRTIRETPNYMHGRFWSDGMVRVSGREYNGLIESPCYKRGTMSCLSCHEMHPSGDDPRPLREWANDQLALGMDGDRACLQCHDDFSDRIAEHSFHELQSSGSRCYNCHMPHTTYGLLKAIRSHEVDSPSVQASLETGRPNACNQCHLDKSLAWTAQHLQKNYDIPVPAMSTEDSTIAASVLWALRGDPGQRALMAWSMGWEAALQASGREWVPPYLAQLLADPYDAVRYIAERSLRRQQGFENMTYDFLGPEDDRVTTATAVVGLWQAQARGRLAGMPQVLIDPRGELLSDVFLRLLAERDNRPLYLRE